MNGLITEGLGTRPSESTLATDGFGALARRVVGAPVLVIRYVVAFLRRWEVRL